MNSDTRYLKREHRLDTAMPLSLRAFARVHASGRSGARLQRAALAWVLRKCEGCGEEAARRSSDCDSKGSP